MKQLALLSLGVLLILSSCSLEKRTYNSGYYIDWKGKRNEIDRKEVTAATNHAKITAAAAESAKPAADNGDDVVLNTSDKTISTPTINTPIVAAKSVQISADQEKSVSTDQVKTNPESKKTETQKQLNSKNNSAKKSAAGGGKNQIVALVLCIFFGYLGIHRFYLGYTGLGILYLLTLGLFGIGWFIDTILLIIPNGLTPKGKTSYDE